jgi:acetolactate synthase I/II/III large subunit
VTDIKGQKMTGGDILLELLETNGIERIFCSPGTEWAPVWEAIAKRKTAHKHCPVYINCRHEMLAVSAAMGYGEASGKMPAVLLHSGIGTLHGSMALRNAYFAKVPMIVLSGETYEHTGNGEIRPQGGHWLGLLSDIGGPSSFVKGYVKWSNAVKSIESMVDLVSRGCRIAASLPEGPSFLSIPLDLLIKSYEGCKVSPMGLADVSFSPPCDYFEKAAALLVEATHPMIISEYGGKTAEAVTGMVELSQCLSIPLFEGNYPFHANFPHDNPLYMGFESTEALKEADVILVVGARTPWYPPKASNPDTTVIFLDDDPVHANLPYWGYNGDMILHSDITEGLQSLIAAVRAKIGVGNEFYNQRAKQWEIRHHNLLTRLDEEAESEKEIEPISPKWFFHKACRVFPENTMVLDETITHMRFVQKYMATPGHYLKSGYGCLGVGIGEAIGTKMAHPDRPVVLFVGDGGFNYNPVLAGLGLTQEYCTPIMIVILNNGGYRAMQRAHEELYPEGCGVSGNCFPGGPIDPAPDYAALAPVFGGYGIKITHPSEIETALQKACEELSAGKTVIVDVLCS